MSGVSLFSFVIPAHNVERYISKTLGSLLSQTDKDFEIIVVDDGSTDNTYNVAKEILEKSGFSNYTILRKPNGGVSSARNMGIKHAKGKYIIFLDGDDYVSPELVEKVKEVVSKSDVDMVCWKFLCVDETGKPTKYQFPQEGLTEGQIYTGLQVLEKILVEKSFWIAVGSAAYSREVMLQNNLFYNENHYVGEDQEFTYKYLMNAEIVLCLGDILSYYVVYSSSSTGKFSERHLDVYPALMEVYRTLVKSDLENTEKIMNSIKERAVLSFISRIIDFSANHSSSFKKLVEISEQRHPGLLEDVLLNARSIEKVFSNLTFFERMALNIFKISPRAFFYLAKFYNFSHLDRFFRKRLRQK